MLGIKLGSKDVDPVTKQSFHVEIGISSHSSHCTYVTFDGGLCGAVTVVTKSGFVVLIF
jgi:hypothetical protein